MAGDADADTITEAEQTTLDIAWFAIDVDGRIGHFTSGGMGFIPQSVAASRTNVGKLKHYFLTVVRDCSDWSSNEGLDKYIEDSVRPDDKHEYMRPSFAASKKGLYSFDCINSDAELSGYFLVTRPTAPLPISDLPLAIVEIISLTTYAGDFSRANEVHAGSFRFSV